MLGLREPLAPQRFTRDQFLARVENQRQLAKQVFSCYEAGPFGCSLHRVMEKCGITNMKNGWMAAVA